MNGPEWIKNDPDALFYDGSQFAVALQVENQETKTKQWAIYTICVRADEDFSEISNLDENGSGDSFTSWSWDDFEFVIPLNSDARLTVKEFFKK